MLSLSYVLIVRLNRTVIIVCMCLLDALIKIDNKFD